MNRNNNASIPYGLARLVPEPLDSYEIFNSIDEAISYINTSGVAYKGNRICVYDTTTNTCSFFIVSPENTLVPDVTTNGLLSRHISEIFIDDDNYMLIYSYDPTYGTTIFTGLQDANCSLKETKYSLFFLLELLCDIDSGLVENHSKLSYKLVVYDPSTKMENTFSFNDNNPNVESNCQYFTKPNDAASFYRINSGAGMNVRICPKTNDTYIVNLYVKVDPARSSQISSINWK